MDPKQMTDEQLVWAAAREIMGWTTIYAAITDVKWEPLTDWNHTMQVVAAMRAKNWRVVIDDFVGDVKFFLDTDADETTWAEARIIEGNIQRAILEAALIAAKGGA